MELNNLTPKKIWTEELKSIRGTIALMLSFTVLVDVLIFIGMIMRIDIIFYLFSYVCTIIPIIIIIILIREVKRKEAI